MSSTMERVIAVPNETETQIARTTREGRKITYKLKVLQQPERARACGSGAKSSADRRPVDPPPIVELRIFEGEKADIDITFEFKANYFLFATLDQARPIAQGRVAQDPNRLTVLTGTPVAGMVYLDRPLPAGYFIFPDLSVRHEGKYRLSFNLYEEIRFEQDDDQIEDEDGTKAQGVGDAHVTHRLEVKSQPFIVYSAKKFPGLASSTSLSRTVAEQGCRVRIRREIRMRKRDKNGKGEWDEYEDDTAYDRARQAATPDAFGQQYGGSQTMADPSQRSRSASIASHVSLAPALSRRASAQEMAQMYHQGYAPQAVAGAQGPVSYTQSPYGPQAVHQYPPQYPGQPSTMQVAMPPPQLQMPNYSYPPQASATHPQYYGYPMPSQSYDSPQHTRTSSIDYAMHMPQEHRRSSTASYQYMAPPQNVPTQSSPYGSVNGYSSGSSFSAPVHQQASMPASMMAPHLLPPLNTSIQTIRDKAFDTSPTSPASVSGYYETHKATGAGDNPPSLPRHVQPTNGKRSYSTVFSTQHMGDSLRGGARPGDNSSGGQNIRADADDTEDDGPNLNTLRMSYRRADGREIARPLPPSH